MANIVKKIISLVLIISSLLTLGACKKDKKDEQEELPAMVDPIDDNYRTFYQIFVGSFSDSSRDGIGDLSGIIDRMD